LCNLETPLDILLGADRNKILSVVLAVPREPMYMYCAMPTVHPHDIYPYSTLEGLLG
jgi:hypothetical protein